MHRRLHPQKEERYQRHTAKRTPRNRNITTDNPLSTQQKTNHTTTSKLLVLVLYNCLGEKEIMGLLFSKNKKLWWWSTDQNDSNESSTSTIPTTTKFQRIQLNGIWCTVSIPSSSSSSSVFPHPKGITFLIPGALLSESSYLSTRNVLHGQGQIVISFYVNVFTTSHDTYAAIVPHIFTSFCQIYNYPFQSFSIVGHSVGAKIGLLVATTNNNNDERNHHSGGRHDDTTTNSFASSLQATTTTTTTTSTTRLDTLVALDPVDDHPPEFTNVDPTQNRALVPKSKVHTHNIVVTYAKATPTFAIPTAHNAQSIVHQSHGTIPLIVQENAAHMCYTDNQGGSIFGWIMKGGSTKQGNQHAQQQAHQLIQKYIGHTE
jgi:hypothetical protein